MCEHGLARQGLIHLTVFKGIFLKAEELVTALEHFQALVQQEGDVLKAVTRLAPFVQSQCDVRQQVQECQEQLEAPLPNHQMLAVKEKLKNLEQGGAGLDLDFFLKNNLLGHLTSVAASRRIGLAARKEFIDLFQTLEKLLPPEAPLPGRARLAQAFRVVEEVELLTAEACYAGKRSLQRRKKLKGQLSWQRLQQMRQRWMQMPQDQQQLFVHLGGGESLMYLVRVAAAECELPLAKEISWAWKIGHQLGLTRTAWRAPEDERLQALLDSFEAAQRKRKRKVVEMESDDNWLLM